MNLNKAKAIFAVGIITVVAGSSVTLWQLNENGIIGTGNTTVIAEENENVEDNNIADDENQQDVDKQEKETETAEPEAENNNVTEEIDKDKISEFLTAFTKVYFSEKKAFDINKYDPYDLILFAFSHIRSTDSAQITIEQRDDSIVYYNKVSYEKVNEILMQYFGVNVPEESVYTENTYAFFSYSDGYFYTPAADGLAYINKAVVRSVENEGGYIVAAFTVYSGESDYAYGEAKIKQDSDGFKLVYYSVER